MIMVRVTSLFMVLALMGCVAREQVAQLPAVTTPAVAVVDDAPLPLESVHDVPQFNPPSGGEVSTYLRGRRALQDGDFGKASTVYLNAVGTTASELQDAALRRQAFSFALAEGNMDTALALAKTFTSAETTESTVWLLRMVEAVNDADYIRASAYLNRAVQGMPSLQHFVLMEVVLGLAGNTITTTEAKVSLDRHEPLDALRAQWAYHKGRLLISLGEDAAGRTLLEQAYSLDPGAVFNVLLYGQGLSVQAQAEVLDQFHQTPANALVLPDLPVLDMALNPKERIGEALFGIGMLMWAQGLDLPALQILYIAHEQYRGVASPVAQLMQYYTGMILEQVGQQAEAKVFYEGLLAGGPRVAAQIRLAQMAYAEGALDAARAYLDGMEPASMAVLQALAETAYQGEDYALALDFYDALLAAAEQEPLDETLELQLHFARGVSHERLGDIRQASRALEQALVLDPENATILNYIGYMWLDAEDVQLTQDKLNQAFSYISKAATLQPNNGAILDSLGWAYYKRGEYAKAQLYLLKALELEPEDPTILEHMGDVSLKLGQVTKARNYWQAALEAGPVSERELTRLNEKLAR